jgi:hypothetical protein
MQKPEWKVDFDKQVAECGIDIAQLYKEYPEPVVKEALLQALSDRTTEQNRTEFEQLYNDAHSDNDDGNQNPQ